FFFSSRRRHTRLQGDWSSDVCSSDLFPISGASRWIKWLMEINPLTYGLDALQLVLFPETHPPTTLALAPSIAVLAAFTAVVFFRSEERRVGKACRCAWGPVRDEEEYE